MSSEDEDSSTGNLEISESIPCSPLASDCEDVIDASDEEPV